jgi:hypothetical protein
MYYCGASSCAKERAKRFRPCQLFCIMEASDESFSALRRQARAEQCQVQLGKFMHTARRNQVELASRRKLHQIFMHTKSFSSKREFCDARGAFTLSQRAHSLKLNVLRRVLEKSASSARLMDALSARQLMQFAAHISKSPIAADPINRSRANSLDTEPPRHGPCPYSMAKWQRRQAKALSLIIFPSFGFDPRK